MQRGAAADSNRDVIVFAVGAAALVAWTFANYPPKTVALVLSSLAMAAASLWSCRTLFGRRAANIFFAIAVPIGWFAEEMGSRYGWFFGDYTYTDVLGPQLGTVPIVIPLMWFGLAHIGLVMASLMLWRHPSPRTFEWRNVALAAFLAAMLVTAFDLAADPYFVFQLKAWIMTKKDGDWFGETVQGFFGWMTIGFVIVALFLVNVKPRVTSPRESALKRAALVPILVFAGLMVFQVCVSEPPELRVISFFAMGIPSLAAFVAWQHWCDRAPRQSEQLAASDTWRQMTRAADPLADATVAAIVGPGFDPADPANAGMQRISQATRLLATWTTNASLDSWAQQAQGADPQIVAAMQEYVQQARALPSWAKRDDIEAAEALFMDYGPLSCVLLFCASLPECYVLPYLSQVLHVAGQLEAHTEYRIRQTAAMVFPVMMKGGLTRPEGGGIAQVLKVRLIHATIRHLILRGAPEQATGRIEALAQASGAANLHEALLAAGWDVDKQGLPCNQLELAYTLLTFNYVFVKGMRTLGILLTRHQEESFLHAWNVIGHVLGIREELMAHTMEEAEAMFEAIQQMARDDKIDPDVRPLLGSALVNTMAKTLEVPVIRSIPVPLTRWLIGRRTANEIGVNQRVSLITRFVFASGLIATRVVDGIVRIFLPGFSIVRMITRVIGYHFLTRFLLDQTRPLALPQELLQPMQRTVAGWGADPKAPRWLTRLEDRMTTPGDWKTAS